MSDGATDAGLLAGAAAESTTERVNGVDLHVVTAGDPADPLVVCLHGFPDFWYGWRKQIPRLVEAGYRVVVPDQRGYNLSEKPGEVAAYRMRELSGDIAALVETTGRDRAHVVGHDWGAAVAWDLALRHPDVVDRLGIVNVPHPTVIRKTLTSNPRQMLRSWYMLAFQVPWLPEWGLGRDGASGIVRVLRSSSNAGAFSETALGHYRQAFQHDGAVGCAVNWYRALVRHRDYPPRERVTAPTRVVWGDDDDALLPEMAEQSLRYCEDGRLHRFPDASHWVHMEEPERVSEILVDHLGE